MKTTSHDPILVTGAAGQLGAVGRTVTGLLLDRRFPVRAMVRRDDERAAADRKSTRLNSSHQSTSRMPSSA